MGMYVCVCARAHFRIIRFLSVHVGYACSYASTGMYVYVYVCVYALSGRECYLYICMYVYIYVCVHFRSMNLYACLHVYMNTYIHTYIHTLGA